MANANAGTIQGQSRVTNAGNISVTAGAFSGIVSTGSGNTITNAASGTIFSQAGSGISLLNGGTVVNDGAITSQTGTGVSFAGTAGGVLINRGTITGAAAGVTFAGGNDRLEMLGGSIAGAVSQGDGADALVIGAGNLASVDPAWAPTPPESAGWRGARPTLRRRCGPIARSAWPSMATARWPRSRAAIRSR